MSASPWHTLVTACTSPKQDSLFHFILLSESEEPLPGNDGTCRLNDMRGMWIISLKIQKGFTECRTLMYIRRFQQRPTYSPFCSLWDHQMRWCEVIRSLWSIKMKPYFSDSWYIMCTYVLFDWHTCVSKCVWTTHDAPSTFIWLRRCTCKFAWAHYVSGNPWMWDHIMCMSMYFSLKLISKECSLHRNLCSAACIYTAFYFVSCNYFKRPDHDPGIFKLGCTSSPLKLKLRLWLFSLVVNILGIWCLNVLPAAAPRKKLSHKFNSFDNHFNNCKYKLNTSTSGTATQVIIKVKGL